MLHRRLLHPESKSPSVSVQQLQKNKKSKTKTKKQASLPASLFVGLFCHVIDLFSHMMGLFCLGVVPFHFRETRPCSLVCHCCRKNAKKKNANASLLYPFIFVKHVLALYMSLLQKKCKKQIAKMRQKKKCKCVLAL